MMEVVEFSYLFDDEGDSKRVVIKKEDKDGLNGADLCDAFVDFMTSAGFSEQNIYDYFKEE